MNSPLLTCALSAIICGIVVLLTVYFDRKSKEPQFILWPLFAFCGIGATVLGVILLIACALGLK